MSEEIKNCPFCGEPPEVRFGGTDIKNLTRFVSCKNYGCPLHVRPFFDYDWNRRACDPLTREFAEATEEAVVELAKYVSIGFKYYPWFNKLNSALLKSKKAGVI